jgi:hypothetical protein
MGKSLPFYSKLCVKTYKVQFIEFLKIVLLNANKMPTIDYENMLKIYL